MKIFGGFFGEIRWRGIVWSGKGGGNFFGCHILSCEKVDSEKSLMNANNKVKILAKRLSFSLLKNKTALVAGKCPTKSTLLPLLLVSEWSL